MRGEIKGYKVRIYIEKKDDMYYATAPGVGSVYIEEDSLDKALELAKDAVMSILDARLATGNTITESNEHVEVVREKMPEQQEFCESHFQYTPKRKSSRNRTQRIRSRH